MENIFKMKYTEDFTVNDLPKRLKRITKWLFWTSAILVIFNIFPENIMGYFILLFLLLIVFYFFQRNYKEFYINFIFFSFLLSCWGLFVFSKILPYILRWEEISWVFESYGLTTVGFWVLHLLSIGLSFVLLCYSVSWARKLEAFIRTHEEYKKTKNWFYDFVIKALEFFKKIK
jgi:hypothetical protein